MLSFILRTLEWRPVNKRIIYLSVPVLFVMLNHTLVMVVDTAMVGRLGAVEVASTGIGGVTYATILSFIIGASMAVQIIVARRFGEDRFQDAGRVLIQGLYISSVLGVLLLIAGYYIAYPLMAMMIEDQEVARLSGSYVANRSLGSLFYFLIFTLRGFFDGIGKTKVGMYSAFAVTISNIFFNWIFIYGNLGSPAMGVAGSAIASSLASIPGMLLFLFYMFRKNMKIYFPITNTHSIDKKRVLFEFYKPDRCVQLELAKIGTPSGLDAALTNLSFVLFSWTASLISVESLAATNVIVAILSLSFMPGYSLGVAATTLVGQAMGRGQLRLAKLSTYRSAFYAAVIMGAMGIFFIIAGSSIFHIFTDNADVIREAVPALMIVSLVQVGDAYHMVMSAVLRSAGLVYYVLIVYVIVSYFVMFPLSYLLGVELKLGTAGLWGGFSVWILILSFVFIRKFNHGDWQSGTV